MIATSRWSDWTLAGLLELKGTTRVSLVVPARNEAATVGALVTRVRSTLMDTVDLVDEIVVIDSDSTDSTASIAAAAGAAVFASSAIRPDLGSYPGKGEAMWKSLFVTTGDVLVFMDADLIEWDTHFVPGLLGPLLSAPSVGLVKGFYERPGEEGPLDGGRVTELVARPALGLWWPMLAGLVQPLAGEWAVRRSLFSSLSVPVGYAVEIAALIDTVSAPDWGPEAIAQVDLGFRAHRHQGLLDLGVMSAQLLAAIDRRLPLDPRKGRNSEPKGQEVGAEWAEDRPELTPIRAREGALSAPSFRPFGEGAGDGRLVQWRRGTSGEVERVLRDVPTYERPPAGSVPPAPSTDQ